MVEPNPAVPAQKTTRIDEEHIVQNIVELLNEKGYEYERDARPIICWRYDVVSSRELSYKQKIEVKESLENGEFEKWGLEYKNKVLNEQVNIVDEIKKLDGAPVDINIKVDDKEKKKTDQSKIKINIKNPAKRTTKVSVSKKKIENLSEPNDEKQIKMSSPSLSADPKKEKDESALLSTSSDSKNEKSKLVQSSPSIKLNALEDKKTEIKLKLVSKDPDAEVQDDSVPKVDTQPKKTQTETVAGVDVEPQEKKTESAVKKILTAHDEDGISADKLDKIDRPKMRIDEAKNIVKERFSVDVEESSLLTSFTLLLTLILFGFSVYTNYLLLLEKSLPEWLTFICSYISK